MLEEEVLNNEMAHRILAHRIQKDIDSGDILDLQECALFVDIKRILFVETDETTDRKVARPIIVYAAEHGSIEIVKFLIEMGCDINARDNIGNTAILCAVENGRVEIVRYLAHLPGVHLDLANRYGETVYSIAKINDDEKIITCLDAIKKTQASQTSTTSNFSTH